MSQQSTAFVSYYDPYLYQTLQGMTGAMIIVQTMTGTVSGKLKGVMPDHIVVESGGSSFFIRIAQIVWVIPRA